MRSAFSIRIVFCFLVFLSFASAQSDNAARVTFSGLAAPAVLKPGKPSEVVLRFVVAPGFHVNSYAPKSDLLIPTALKIDPSGSINTKGISYPEGKDLALPFDPDTKLSVYSGEFLVRASLLASSGAAAGTTALHGELRYQACSDRACFPPKTLPLDFNVTLASH